MGCCCPSMTTPTQGSFFMPDFDPLDDELFDQYMDSGWRVIDKQLAKTLASIARKKRNSPETKNRAKQILNSIWRGKV